MKQSRIIRLDDMIARAVRVYRVRKIAGRPYMVALKRAMENREKYRVNKARS